MQGKVLVDTKQTWAQNMSYLGWTGLWNQIHWWQESLLTQSS